MAKKMRRGRKLRKDVRTKTETIGVLRDKLEAARAELAELKGERSE
jgi:hypothetical protein